VPLRIRPDVPSDPSPLDAIGRQVVELRHELAQMRAALEAATSALRTMAERSQETLEAMEARSTRSLSRMTSVLQLLYDREPAYRERVRALRATEAYERAYTDPEPLVSVVIPTYDNSELLLRRAVASALAQTYVHLEVVVVGDCAPPETGRLLSEVSDPRVRYHNLPIRGPYPDDPRDRWHVAGIPPRNEAVAQARGAWIAPLDDDDAFAADHVEALLDLARGGRHEVAYGLMRCVMHDGSTFNLGAFPPVLGQFGWQAAIFHQGLAMFEMELADALFFSPGDWSLCRRMLRAGVRFGMLDRVVVDHYESRYSPDYREEEAGPQR